ncbi:SEC-C metal-binding domain-containing protein [Nitrosomonas sp.]|uniref:SEC-C metal-binding domain-containing protein n=1 Tax=Nitrosomonas sp. TaxID=42353 RepID=UPI00208D3B91|nr:SEC-C metal-binding domain-containing protein [Nitrosomonas sp.]GJL74740.1 MAG: hypothetical protein NMNS02_08460 [Nitrosomonas sp.]
MKIGRNDPCPCGSGKKYKQCCLKNQELQQVEDFLWHQIRHVINVLPEKLLKFSSKRFGNAALLEAWAAFMDSDDVEFSPDTPHLHIFLSWFFYDWHPDQSVLKESAAFEPLRDQTLAQLFLEKHRKQLEPLLVRYIEQCCSAHYSFYDIVSVRTGDGFLLRDIMTGEEEYVTEHAGSQNAQAGDIVFGKFVKLDHVAVLEASASIFFPPVEKRSILDLRENICEVENPPSQALLRDYDYDMLEIYHEIYDRLNNPVMPKIQNADGDELLFHRLKYDIDSPRQAFDALKQLSPDTTDEEVLADAEFDSAGELYGVYFLWQQQANAGRKSERNTILGQIEIEGNQLTVEVDSEARAQQFRQLAEELLPAARYRVTVIESMESRLVQEESRQETDAHEERDTFDTSPEAQTQITELLREHYRRWPEETLPILNGKTPLEAIKTKAGREMVEALLLDFERKNLHANPPMDTSILTELRERLGLNKNNGFQAESQSSLIQESVVLPVYAAEELGKHSLPALIDIVIQNEDRVPLNVIQECARRGESMFKLIKAQHEDGSLWQDKEDIKQFWWRLHMVMILGLMPQAHAGLLLVEFMCSMSREKEDNLQDWLSSCWPGLFRNKPASTQAALRKLCENKNEECFVRAYAVDAVVSFAAEQGGDSLEQTLKWLAGMAADEDEDFDFRLLICHTLLEHPRDEYMSLLEDLAERQDDWIKHFSIEDVRLAYETNAIGRTSTPIHDPWKFYEPGAIMERQIRWQKEDG